MALYDRYYFSLFRVSSDLFVKDWFRSVVFDSIRSVVLSSNSYILGQILIHALMFDSNLSVADFTDANLSENSHPITLEVESSDTIDSVKANVIIIQILVRCCNLENAFQILYFNDE
ncbi:hypothetical protein QL285_027845 [Trifolium repens]|nr:hypothetical protein QL285_027845 [Trifolium repens]